MSARSLGFIAVGVTAPRGPVHGMFGGNHGGSVACISLATIPTVLDRFIRDMDDGKPDPFHRSADEEPSFEQRDPDEQNDTPED